MQNIVLDTNSLLMAISAKNIYHRVWLAFLREEYILCITNEIIEEYLEVISRNINPLVAEAIVSTILMRKNVLKLDPHFRFDLIEKDKDDNKFVDCAIAGNASYIVTEDHHFNILKEIKFPSVSVIGIDDFLLLLDSFNNIILNEPAIAYNSLPLQQLRIRLVETIGMENRVVKLQQCLDLLQSDDEAY